MTCHLSTHGAWGHYRGPGVLLERLERPCGRVSLRVQFSLDGETLTPWCSPAEVRLPQDEGEERYRE